jgi:hypothetical protein
MALAFWSLTALLILGLIGIDRLFAPLFKEQRERGDKSYENRRSRYSKIGRNIEEIEGPNPYKK